MNFKQISYLLFQNAIAVPRKFFNKRQIANRQIANSYIPL